MLSVEDVRRDGRIEDAGHRGAFADKSPVAQMPVHQLPVEEIPPGAAPPSVWEAEP